MRWFIALLAVVPAIVPMTAQEIKMPPGLDKLADKASDVVDISLDGSLLQLASRFLSEKDPDEAHVKRIVSGLKGVYVKSFEFDERDQYNQSDVEEIRAQLKAPGWSRIVTARSKKNGENSEIYLKTEAGQIAGLVVIAAEPKELTIINFVGSIRPEDVRDLGGRMGIPKIDVAPAKPDKPAKDEKDNKEDNQ